MIDYPKWVKRAPDIGPVLCLTADEEKTLMDDWNNFRLEVAEQAAAEAEIHVKMAREEAEIATERATERANLPLRRGR